MITRTTLADFILARIAEDEAVARNAGGAPWVAMETAPWVQVDPAAIRDNKWAYGRLGHVATAEHQEYAEHIALHDPARVLAQCAALRKVVSRCSPTLMDAWQDAHDREWDEGRDVREFTLRALAAIWADHEDHHDEWRP